MQHGTTTGIIDRWIYGYIPDVIKAGREFADGVLIYCHQDPEKSAENVRLLKKDLNKFQKFI